MASNEQVANAQSSAEVVSAQPVRDTKAGANSSRSSNLYGVDGMDGVWNGVFAVISKTQVVQEQVQL